MPQQKQRPIRYRSAVSSPRHLVICCEDCDGDNEKTPLIRRWINEAGTQINRRFEELGKQVGDAPRFVVTFGHSIARNSAEPPSWSSIYESAADHHKDGVRVLVRFSKPQPQIEQAARLNQRLPSHLIGVQISDVFGGEPNKGICDLAVALPFDRVAFQNFLVDIASDIFLFHHFAAITLGTGAKPVQFRNGALRAFSEEKIKYARERNLRFYGTPLGTGALSSASYVSFSGCLRKSITHHDSNSKDLIQLWEGFFNFQFPRIFATDGGRGLSNEEKCAAMASSLLSLTRIGGQISRSRVLKQMTSILGEKPRSNGLLFCFVMRKAPPDIKREINRLIGRHSRPGRHAVVDLSKFPSALQLSPYLFIVRLYRNRE